jgi:hypothetical protein
MLLRQSQLFEVFVRERLEMYATVEGGPELSGKPCLLLDGEQQGYASAAASPPHCSQGFAAWCTGSPAAVAAQSRCFVRHSAGSKEGCKPVLRSCSSNRVRHTCLGGT